MAVPTGDLDLPASLDELPEASIDGAQITDIFFAQVGPSTSEDEQPPSQVDTEAEKLRAYYTRHFGRIVQTMVEGRLITAPTGKAIAQAATPAVKRDVRARFGPSEGTSRPSMPSWQLGSQQYSYEDLYATLDFIPLPRSIALELYEREIFEEDHIAGACIDRTATAVIKRGYVIARYDDNLDQESTSDGEENPETAADKGEASRIGSWLDNINPYVDFRHIIKETAARYTSTGNGYVEVVRNEESDVTSEPARLATMISSSMRVMKGHRGFIQWIAGQFRWFNNYTPNLADRQSGVALWEQHWSDRGLDPYSDQFASSPFAKMLSSSMPEGVFNPNLTEVKHFKNIHLSSVYYGFPRDYRIARLHALLKWSMDYNIGMQKNNQVPPFALVFHGSLTADRRADLQNYLQSLKGSQNYGKIPILESPPVVGGGQTGNASPKSSLEIVTFQQGEHNGMFLDLWSRVIKDLAMHYGFPLDLLTTENSNRATIQVAEQLFNDFVVNEHHEMFEPWLKQMTLYDMGLTRRRVAFVKLDTDDLMQRAQIAQIYHSIGVLNANEVRADDLHKPARPGGEQYIEIGLTTVEDEPAEEMLDRLAAKIRAGDMSPEDAKAYIDSVTNGGGSTAPTPSGQPVAPSASPTAALEKAA